jgi:hypothetical protein
METFFVVGKVFVVVGVSSSLVAPASSAAKIETAAARF